MLTTLFGQQAATQYWLTRFCFQRALALIYLTAFSIAAFQGPGLIGSRGLLPARLFLERVKFWDAPSLFWLNSSDTALSLAAWLGVGLSLFAISGLSESYGMVVSVVVWAAMWMLYRSIVSVGQTFYGFGWEMLLIETGFLAIFLGSKDTQPPVVVIWMLRWVLFRLMFGAGLIKIRGDECWRDLTCMYYHYETQPLPGPLSWSFHYLPKLMHKAAVLFTHLVELPLPFAYFFPAPVRVVAGIVTILFQCTLLLSGNLSWLNCITIVLCIACFDDRSLARFFDLAHAAVPAMSEGRIVVLGVLCGLVLVLSIRPTINLLSAGQLMNASFDPLDLVNTYGAFGSVTRERTEIILEGTSDPVITAETRWKEYEFKGKPGDPKRMPPQVTPYHYKLDWQMWFAAMSSYQYHPWILNLINKLLRNEPAVVGLIRTNPFADKPPRFIRASLYHYVYSTPEQREAGYWWRRLRLRDYLRPLSLDDPQFRSLLEEMRWAD